MTSTTKPAAKPFFLGPDAQKQGRKSLKGMVAHFKKAGGREAVYVTINTKITFLKERDFTPRVIPASHPIDKVSDKSILLITVNPSTPFREPLMAKGSPTEDFFNQVYSLNKLKLETKNLYKLYKEFDIVVADPRVHKLLPRILKAQFYEKNKKVPFMVQMAKPEPERKLLPREQRRAPKKEEPCDPKYVARQIKAIVGNPFFIAPVNGSVVTIKIGYTDWPVDHLQDNLNDVVTYLVDPKYKPIGGLVHSIDKIISVHVKTSEGISMPVFENKPAPESSDSDFDF